MLDLIQEPQFRSAIAKPAFENMVHSQQLYFWQHWRANREKDLRSKAQPELAKDAAMEVDRTNA